MQLARRGFGTDEETEGLDDPIFLMEVMEAQEAVNESDEAEVLRSMKSRYLKRQSDIVQVTLPCIFVSESCIEERSVVRLQGLRRREQNCPELSTFEQAMLFAELPAASSLDAPFWV